MSLLIDYLNPESTEFKWMYKNADETENSEILFFFVSFSKYLLKTTICIEYWRKQLSLSLLPPSGDYILVGTEYKGINKNNPLWELLYRKQVVFYDWVEYEFMGNSFKMSSQGSSPEEEVTFKPSLQL